MSHNDLQNVIALDIGTVRIGVARANGIARIAEALTTLPNDESFATRLQKILTDQEAKAVVVGLPRNLSGDETHQTTYVRDFVASLHLDPRPVIHWQDEAVSSVTAEANLKALKKPYDKGDIDAEAARIILQDYLDAGSIE